MIGVKSFFAENRSIFGVKVVNVATFFYLTRADFLNTIKKFPQDFETYCMIRDNLKFIGTSNGIDTKCSFC